MNEILKYTINAGQRGPRSNGNEGVLHTHQIACALVSPSDEV